MLLIYQWSGLSFNTFDKKVLLWNPTKSVTVNKQVPDPQVALTPPTLIFLLLACTRGRACGLISASTSHQTVAINNHNPFLHVLHLIKEIWYIQSLLTPGSDTWSGFIYLKNILRIYLFRRPFHIWWIIPIQGPCSCLDLLYDGWLSFSPLFVLA